MGVFIMLITGGLVGWIANRMVRRRSLQSLLLSILIGMAGALLPVFLIVELRGRASITVDDPDAFALLVSFAGAVILSAIFCLFRRRPDTSRFPPH
ncbi:MAG: GlsB/YeaQ/YmgE family stress response membrane protein [Novosphingobium sp.]|nr:GlsB/YeaQ/YmgE family stress response membrane protein [Novosphingobium sp.]